MLALVERAPVTHVKPDRIAQRMACRLPWAWDGLVFLTAMQEADAAVTELQAGLQGVFKGSARWADTELGLTVDGSANTAGDDPVAWVDFGTATTPMAGRNQLSGFVVFYVQGLPVQLPSVLYSKFRTVACYLDTAGQTRWEVFGDEPGAPSTIVGRATVGVHSYTPGQWGSFGMSWNNDTGGTMTAYEGGRLVDSETWPFTTAGLYDDPTYAGMLLARHYSANTQTTPSDAFQGKIALLAFWGRALTATEHAALAADPFGMISPSRESLVLSAPFPLVGFGPHRIGKAGQVEVSAPVNAGGQITSVQVTNPTELGTTLRLTVNATPESHAVAAGGSYTRTVNPATETVTRFGVTSDPGG